MSKGVQASAARAPTWHFLQEARCRAPVHMQVADDMTRALASCRAEQVGVNALLLRTIAGVLARRPAVNADVFGLARPRKRCYESVHAKLVLDKRLGGTRVVCSAVIPRADRLSLDEIQQHIDFHKQADADRSPAFASMRLLARLPHRLGGFAYRRAIASVRGRHRINGSFTLSALGAHALGAFHPVGGNAMTFGVGRIAQAAVVRNGRPAAAPVLNLCLSFDHRVVDGAEAAECLDEIRRLLEAG